MENFKCCNRARSTGNGIIFYSNLFSIIATEVYYDKSGEIHTRLMFVPFLDLKNSIYDPLCKNELLLNRKFITLFNVILFLFSLIVHLFWNNFGLVLATASFTFFVTEKLFIFLNSFFYIKFTNKSNARFHAAEHMAINAYEALQRIPTLDEIKNFSRFSRNCGSKALLSSLFSNISICLAMAFLLSHNSIAYLITILFIILIAIADQKFSCLRFLQLFVTSKPNDKELILAIEGLRQFEIMEDQITTRKLSLLDIENPFESEDCCSLS